MSDYISMFPADKDLDSQEYWQSTQATLKQIEANRERSNKVTALLGTYLLKGYVMLNSSCDVCQCVLMKNKTEEAFCISCREFGGITELLADNSQDMEEEESSQRTSQKERQLKEKRNDLISGLIGNYLLNGYAMLASTCNICQTILLKSRSGKEYCVCCKEVEIIQEDVPETKVTPEPKAMTTLHAFGAPTVTAFSSTSKLPNYSQMDKCLDHSMKVVCQKLEWATQELAKSADVQSIKAYCDLIYCCTTTLAGIRGTRNAN